MKAWVQTLAIERPEEVGAPLESVAASFLNHAKRSVGHETFARYSYYVADFCNFVGSEQARHVKPFHVTRWTEARPDWGPWAQRSAIAAVKRMYSWAVGEELLERSPISKVKRPAAQSRQGLIDDEQHAAMMAAATHDGTDTKRTSVFRQMMIALRHSGARPGTVAAVRVEDVSPTGDAWILAQHKTRAKTGKPLVVWLSPCLSTLTKILAAAKKTGRLFLNFKGQPWGRNAIRCRMKRLRKKLGLPDNVIAYAYRHSYATRAMLAGNDVATVAELLGHSDVGMIARHYGHLDQARSHMKNAAAKAIAPQPR